MMKEVLTYGRRKNYYTTEKYLQAFLKQQYSTGDIPLKKLTYEFITGFEFFIRPQPLKNFDRCSDNGTMKHLELLKKIVKWGTENGWIDRNPFEPFKLKFKRKEWEYLSSNDIVALEQYHFANSTNGSLSLDLSETNYENEVRFIDRSAMGRNYVPSVAAIDNQSIKKSAFVSIETGIDGESMAVKDIFQLIV